MLAQAPARGSHSQGALAVPTGKQRHLSEREIVDLHSSEAEVLAQALVFGHQLLISVALQLQHTSAANDTSVDSPEWMVDDRLSLGHVQSCFTAVPECCRLNI